MGIFPGYLYNNQYSRSLEVVVAIVKIVLEVIVVIASILLTLLILMHKGKGGGLSDMFGGASAPTPAPQVLPRRT